MNPVLDKAKAHFAQVANKGMQSLEVEEWDTEVYWKIGGLNFAQQSKVIELQQAGKSAEALVEMLILRALDGEGKRLFKPAEKVMLMNSVDPNVILKIVTAMGESDTAFAEEDPVGN